MASFKLKVCLVPNHVSISNLTSWPFFGISLAMFGALLITPDTLFMRLSGFDGWPMVSWRGLEMGGLLLCLWLVIFRRQLGADLQQLRTKTGFAAIICQSSGSVFFILAVAETSVALVLFCLATIPIFAAIFSAILIGERTKTATWITMLVAFAGIGIAVLDGESTKSVMAQGSGAVWLGTVYALSAAACVGTSFVFIRMNEKLNIVLMSGCQASMTGILGLCVLMATEGGLSQLTAGHIGYISVNGLLILPLSFVCLSWASRYTQAANVGLLMLLETILGPIWVWLGVGEAVSLQMIIGGAITVIALAVYISATAMSETKT